MDQQHLILFDGACGFCRRSVAWLLARDKGGLFVAMPYQEAPSPPMTPGLFAACKDAVHVVLRDGKILKGGGAVLFLMENTGLGALASILAVPPCAWLVEPAYRLVARNRPLFGRFFFPPAHRKP